MDRSVAQGPCGRTAAGLERAFPGWRVIGTEAASTDGMPKPLRRAAPTWYPGPTASTGVAVRAGEHTCDAATCATTVTPAPPLP